MLANGSRGEKGIVSGQDFLAFKPDELKLACVSEVFISQSNRPSRSS